MAEEAGLSLSAVAANGYGDEDVHEIQKNEVENMELKIKVRRLMPKENLKFDINKYSRGMLLEDYSLCNGKPERDEVAMDPTSNTGKTVAEFSAELNQIFSLKKIQSRLYCCSHRIIIDFSLL